MKRCPQCNNVFEDSAAFCPNDATALVSEEFALPSEVPPDDEEITVIRSEPLTIPVPQSDIPTEQFQSPLPPPNVVPVVVEKPKNNSLKYLALLLTGLIFGGALVLTALFLAENFNRDKETQIAGGADRNGQANSAGNTKTATPEPAKTADAKHSQRTVDADSEFNGRVITLNAYVRASPDRNSTEVDILPVDDRLTIMNRENDDSPWFFVACEHGASGWMHGNTIEYTR